MCMYVYMYVYMYMHDGSRGNCLRHTELLSRHTEKKQDPAGI